MVIVRDHNKTWSDNDYTPLCAWPDTCTVQWGRSGLVVNTNDGSMYRTAFFEAFPVGVGFTRGEGKTLKAAEEDAFKKYARYAACSEHIYSRKHYKNGGGICQKCGNFGHKAFRPIVILGQWKEPAPSWFSAYLSDPEPPRGDWKRPLWLRGKHFGVEDL